jgi:hypothetical protein
MVCIEGVMGYRDGWLHDVFFTSSVALFAAQKFIITFSHSVRCIFTVTVGCSWESMIARFE